MTLNGRLEPAASTSCHDAAVSCDTSLLCKSDPELSRRGDGNGEGRAGSSTEVESDSDSSSSSSDTQFPNPPDGGYGWVIVFAAFSIHAIADGVNFSFGVFYPSIQERYQANKASAGWVGSIFMAMPLLMGPAASAVQDRWGFRYTTMLAGVAAGTGFLLSRWAPSLPVLYLTFGVVTGLGLAVAFNTCIVAVTYYFLERRGLAMGIAVCGSGIGTLFLAPIVNLLLEAYGWDGALLVLSAVFYQIIVCGALLRDLEWPEDTLDYKRAKFERHRQRRLQRDSRPLSQANSRHESGGPAVAGLAASAPVRTTSLLAIPTYISPPKAQAPKPKAKSIAAHIAHLGRSEQRMAAATAARGKRTRLISHSESALHNESPEQQRPLDPRGRALTTGAEGLLASSSDCSETQGEKDETDHSTQTASRTATTAATRTARSFSEADGPGRLSKRLRKRSGAQKAEDWLASHPPKEWRRPGRKGSVESGVQAEAVTKPRAGTLLTSRVGGGGQLMHLRTAYYPAALSGRSDPPFVSAPALYKPSRHRKRPPLSPWRQLLKWANDARETYFDDMRIVLRSPAVLLIMLSNFLLYAFYDIPYVNLPEYAAEKAGLSEKESTFLVSIMGGTNTLGMVVYGLIADRRWVNNTAFYGVSCVICGVVVGVFPVLSHSYLLYSTSVAVFGFFVSANYTLTTVLLMEYVKLTDFANAYGVVCFVQGIGTLIGPPLAGHLYDVTGDYVTTFVAGGVGIAVSGLIVFGILLLPPPPPPLRRLSDVSTADELADHLPPSAPADSSKAALLPHLAV